MRAVARRVCLTGWILAVAVALFYFYTAPRKLVISGTDLSQVNSMAKLYQLAFTVFGLLIVGLSYVFKRWSAWLVLIASALYLLRWFPYPQIAKYGLVAVAKSMWIVGSNSGLVLTFAVRDVILPATFLLSIILVLVGVTSARVSDST
jgi:hypothetical protein